MEVLLREWILGLWVHLSFSRATDETHVGLERGLSGSEGEMQGN